MAEKIRVLVVISTLGAETSLRYFLVYSSRTLFPKRNTKNSIISHSCVLMLKCQVMWEHGATALVR